MSEYLIHHGTKGMKWGVRKYQNADGSLTPAGKQRYGGGSIAGGVNRLGAKISSVNERYYKKKADKLYSYAKAERGIAGANRRVKNEHLRKADEARARGGIGGHLSSAGHRVAAKVYESNEKWWDKEAAADSAKAKKNRLREGMNRSARKSFEKQAEREDARAIEKRSKNNAGSSKNRSEKSIDQGAAGIKEKAKKLHVNDVLNKAADELDDRATKDWFNDKGKMVNGKNVAASALRSISNRNMSELRSTIDSYDFFNDTKYGEKFDNVMDYVDTLVKGKR